MWDCFSWFKVQSQVHSGPLGAVHRTSRAEDPGFFVFLRTPDPAGGLPAAREARAELEPTPPTDHAMAAPKVVVGTSYGELRPWRAAPAGFDRSVHAKPKLMVGTIAAIEQQKYHDEADGPMAA